MDCSAVSNINEYNLLVALLERALLDYHATDKAISSEGWFKDNSLEPFSFLWVLRELRMEQHAMFFRQHLETHKFVSKGGNAYMWRPLDGED